MIVKLGGDACDYHKINYGGFTNRLKEDKTHKTTCIVRNVLERIIYVFS